MICKTDCPRGTKCTPVSNVVSTKGHTFVCVGYHGEEKKDYPTDKFRHCFVSESTDTMFDYDEFDLQSCATVFNAALLIDSFEEE